MFIYAKSAYKSSYPSTFFLGGLNWESGLDYTLLCTSTSCLCPSSPYPQFLYPQDSPAPQQQTNMGGGIVEQQPIVPTQDSQRLEEDRATHSPSAREEEGPSGAT